MINLDDPSLLIWGMLFSIIGFGFFRYGKKQKVLVPFVCGLSLMIYPYFVTNLYALIATGVTLIAIPYFIKI